MNPTPVKNYLLLSGSQIKSFLPCLLFFRRDIISSEEKARKYQFYM